MAPPILFDVLACVAALFSVCYIYGKRKYNLPLPPGPKGYPIVGNLFDLPSHIWVKFRDWSKDIGSDIIYLNILGTHVVVLHSLEAVNDLFDKRSSIYSDRPQLLVSLDLMGFLAWDLAVIPYGDLWRSQRRLMHHVLHPTAVRNFRPHTLKATRRALRRFLENPEEVIDNLRHMTGDTILNITYGINTKPENDPYLATSDRAVRLGAEAALLGTYLVDLLPILKYIPEWVPGSFQSTAREGREVCHKVLEAPYKAAKDLIDSGNYVPSFISDCLSLLSQVPPEEYTWQEFAMKGAAATLYLAGTDTTSSTISYCVAFLVNHPDVLKQAQAEIDSVIPYGELPTFDEEDKLPFINALFMETMRLKELVPLSVPHSVTEDDVYRGYRIPKGTVVIANAWAVFHDEKSYPDPFLFKPERFLKDGKIDKSVLDTTKIGFGFGRRICPGRYMASATVWLTIASLVAAFEITKSVDANGKPIDVEIADNDCVGLLRMPKPFKCMLKPRSEKHAQTIRATVNEEY